MSETPTDPSTAHTDPTPPIATPPHDKRKQSMVIRWIIAVIVVVVLLAVGIPWVHETLTTVSTDDAYVNGHVTFVAPRVGGQVARVLVDDNNRVHRGDLLVQLDPESYRVQLAIAQSAVDAANADLNFAIASVRGTMGQARSLRFALEHAIEDVDNQIALLRSKVAAVAADQSTLDRAKADYNRALSIQQNGDNAISQAEIDKYKNVLLVAQSALEQSVQGVYQVRVALGLSPTVKPNQSLADVPEDLDQNFSSVRQAQMQLMQVVAQLGVSDSFNTSPRELIANFYKRDPEGNIDRIYEKLLPDAPLVKQAHTKLDSAIKNLDEAKLNLKYCNVVAEIDGVVTRRNVNPGNNVVAGQSLMAVRSLTEIWVDANFKETQLNRMRIGQPAELEVDMYGGSHHFNGRVSGITMGTGSTLALLPAENATGNFVKVVQRVPVRIELTDYDPNTAPLIIGTSVEARVKVNKQSTGNNAGKILQPYTPTTTQPATSPATEAAQ